MTSTGAPIETDLKSVSANGTLENLIADGSWKSSSFEFTDLLDPHEHEYRRSFTTEGQQDLLVSHGGRPTRTDGNKTTNLHTWIHKWIVSDYSPYAMLWSAYTMQGVGVRMDQPQSYQGHQLTRITVTTSAGEKNKPVVRAWFLDSSTMLPLFSVSRFQDGDNPYLFSPLKISYENYVACGVHLCPSLQTQSINGRDVRKVHVTQSSVTSTTPNDAMFSLGGAK